jgi:prolipoprotein diacylglyceryltransferase
MKMVISNQGFLFAFFYALSFTAVFVVVVIFSIRRKIPLQSVLLLLTTVTLMTIIGSRLFTAPFKDWGYIASAGNLDNFHGRSAMGGLLFGLAGFIISQKILGLGRPIVELYAWISPIGFGIQKIGCFLNGCCFGRPTSLPWGISYPVGTSAHFHHLLNGLIDQNASYSLNIHPVQLYETIGFFTLAFIVWRTQKKWERTYSTLLFSLFLFLILRFFSEFIRDPTSSGFSSTYFWGISTFQWGILTFGILSAVLLLINEKRLRKNVREKTISEPSLRKTIVFILIISFIVYFLRGMFSSFELYSLYIKFVPAILLTGYLVTRSLAVYKVRLVSTSFLILPLFLITQTFPQDSVKQKESIQEFYQNKVLKYKRIDFGTSFGSYYNTLRYNPNKGECGTTYTNEDYEYVYRMAGAGFSSVKKDEKSIKTLGVNLYGGINKERNITKDWKKSHFLLGVNPYIKSDVKWIGIGVGLHIGNLRWVPVKPIDEITFNSGTRFSPVLPEVYLRVGRRDILDLKYTYGFNNPTPFPLLMSEFSVGSGFGNKSEVSLRFGEAFSDNHSFSFISFEGLVDKKLGLNIKYNFGGDQYLSTTNQNINTSGSLLFGLNYRFGFEK